MADQKINVILSLKDQMSPALKTAKRGVDDFSKGAKSSFMEINQALELAQKGVEAMKQAYDFAKEGAQLMALRQQGEVLASSMGQDLGKIVKAIKDASNNTITESDAMSVAMRAMRLDVAKTPEEFEQLTKASLALGQVMGRGPVDAINDITTGVGRMSPMILDNLGILTKGGAIFDDYAKRLGTTVDKLTDTQKKQILLNQAMKDAVPLLDENGNVATTAATEFQAFDAQVKTLTEHLKELAGQALTPVITEANNVIEAETKIAALHRLGLHTDIFKGYMTDLGVVVAHTDEELWEYIKTQDAMAATNLLSQESIYGVKWAFLGLKEEIPVLVEALKESAVPAVALLGDKLSGTVVDVDRLLASSQEYLKWLIGPGAEMAARVEDIMARVRAGTLGALGAQQELNRAWLEWTGYSKVTKGTGTGRNVNVAEQRQHGGPLGAINLVGEAGPEMIVNGVVIPAHLTRMLMALGLVPGQRLVTGGVMPDPGNVTQVGRRWDLSTPKPILDYWAGTQPKIAGTAISISGGSAASSPAVAAAQAVAEQTIAYTSAQSADTVTQIKASGAQQRELMAGMVNQQMAGVDAQLSKLDKIINVLQSQADAYEMRQIMRESKDTSGF